MFNSYKGAVMATNPKIVAKGKGGPPYIKAQIEKVKREIINKFHLQSETDASSISGDKKQEPGDKK